jgi:hypothetical protein
VKEYLQPLVEGMQMVGPELVRVVLEMLVG